MIGLEWGLHGLHTLASRYEVLIIVDVLSFSTAVDVAVGRGATVLPCALRDESAAAHFAAAHHALLAASRQVGGYSLSPASLLSIPAGTRLVLPSPNGATLSEAAAASGRHVLAGCLRNATAVARAAAKHGRALGIVVAGERWPDGSLRPAIEDLLGGGAIAAALVAQGAPLSAEATVAAAAFNVTTSGTALDALLRESVTGQELIAMNFGVDVDLAAALDCSRTVPVLRAGAYEAMA